MNAACELLRGLLRDEGVQRSPAGAVMQQQQPFSPADVLQQQQQHSVTLLPPPPPCPAPLLLRRAVLEVASIMPTNGSLSTLNQGYSLGALYCVRH